MHNATNSQQNIWHALIAERVLASLGTSARGLSQEEAARRLAAEGPNELLTTAGPSARDIFFRQFKNVLIIILIIATGMSALLGHALEAVAIAIIILFAVLLGFYQEFRAERAMDALRRMAAPTSAVLRDGEEVEVSAREIVRGDVVLLRAGSKVPADGRLIEAINLQVDEAALTGESTAVSKITTELLTPDMAVGDRINMVYAGTAASYGRGRAVVVGTGMQTEFGRIAQMLQMVKTEQTPLQQNLDQAGRSLARAALAIVGLIVIIGIARSQPILDILIFGIALAVAVVPEALPAVVTISLAIGVQRMVKRQALIRHLPAVETLGSTSVICSDKTGTLTRDQMTVRRLFIGGRFIDVSGAGYEPEGEFLLEGENLAPDPALMPFLIAAVLVNDAQLREQDADHPAAIKGDPTEAALLVVAAKAGIRKDELDSKHPRVHEIPFTSTAKRMTTLHQHEDEVVAYTKGAPEVLLPCCTRQLTADQREASLSEQEREAILDAARQMASDALRVLAVARRRGATAENAEGELTFLGLAGMIDPPRPEAKEAIETCRRAGIRPMMITGDHPTTAAAVARELGLSLSGQVVSGQELDQMSDAELSASVEQSDVFARVSPTHKLRIVSALQQHGHVVAMTGDGVNDAPALKKADIGVAMGITGTDVSKEAADMTLLDDNFASIVAAVEEGRGIYDNVRKFLLFLISSNVGEILLVLGASIFGLPVPLTAVQILFVNLATDGLPALALAVDPPARDLMRMQPRNPRASIFSRPVLMLMIAGGAWSAAVNLQLFASVINSADLAKARAMTFTALVLIELLKAYNFRSDHTSAFTSPFSNKWLNMAVGMEALVLVAITQIEFFQAPLGLMELSAGEWLRIILTVVTLLPILELMKWHVRRTWREAQPSRRGTSG